MKLNTILGALALVPAVVGTPPHEDYGHGKKCTTTITEYTTSTYGNPISLRECAQC